jgi:hypothetical protein
MRRAIFTASLVLVTGGIVHADTWLRANLYFIEWSTTTRVALTPQRVRELADYKATFQADAPQLAASLHLEQLKKAKDREREDARLVVDLFTDTDTRVTYYASVFHLCSEDNVYKRAIGPGFRKQFADLARHQQRDDAAAKK